MDANSHEQDPSSVRPPNQETEFLSVIDGLNRSLSTFNSGPKAYLMLLIEQFGGTTSANYLLKPFQEIVDRSKFKYSGATNRLIEDYLMNNHVPNGLITRQTNVNRDGVDEYSITKLGYRYGIDVAARMLWFENEYPIRIYQIFGATETNSPDKIHSPLVRAQIIHALGSSPEPLTATELQQSNSLPVNTGIGPTLYELIHSGVIIRHERKSSIQPNQLDGNRLAVYNACRSLLRDRNPLTIETVISKMGLPVNDIEIQQTIQGAINDLDVAGLLSQTRYEYTLSQSGKTIDDRLLKPIIRILQGELTEESQTVTAQVKQDLIKHAINSFKHYALDARSTKHAELSTIMPQIASFLLEFPGSSITDLAQALGQNRGSLQPYLNEMINKGEIVKAPINKKDFCYYPSESKQEP